MVLIEKCETLGSIAFHRSQLLKSHRGNKVVTDYYKLMTGIKFILCTKNKIKNFLVYSEKKKGWEAFSYRKYQYKHHMSDIVEFEYISFSINHFHRLSKCKLKSKEVSFFYSDQ